MASASAAPLQKQRLTCQDPEDDSDDVEYDDKHHLSVPGELSHFSVLVASCHFSVLPIVDLRTTVSQGDRVDNSMHQFLR